MSKAIDLEAQLRDAIGASGQSLNQLGQAAGVDSGRLSRFMRGERGLTLEAAGRLCRVLSLHLAPMAEPSKKGKG
jgi:transcriptional regulator with XRE-family HTH domain